MYGNNSLFADETHILQKKASKTGHMEALPNNKKLM